LLPPPHAHALAVLVGGAAGDLGQGVRLERRPGHPCRRGGAVLGPGPHRTVGGRPPGKKDDPREAGRRQREARVPYSSGTSSSATMLMILISGLMAGPAVSLSE